MRPIENSSYSQKKKDCKWANRRDNLNDYKNARAETSCVAAPKCERGHVPEFRNIFVRLHLQTHTSGVPGRRRRSSITIFPDRGGIVSSNRRLDNGKILTHGTFLHGTAHPGTLSLPFSVHGPKAFHGTCSNPDPKVQQKGKRDEGVSGPLPKRENGKEGEEKSKNRKELQRLRGEAGRVMSQKGESEH